MNSVARATTGRDLVLFNDHSETRKSDVIGLFKAVSRALGTTY